MRPFWQILEEAKEAARAGDPPEPAPRKTGLRPFWQILQEAKEAARNESTEDPWEPTLSKLKGRVGQDGVERLSTADTFDHLEIPLRCRPGLTNRLSRVMRKLGWHNIRARGLNPGSYRDRVRGFAREAPGHPATTRLPNEF